MKIILVRHAKTKIDSQIPITRWGLSQEGISLAQKLSENNIIKQIDILYSSLQTKSLETAVILAKPNAIPIKTDDRLTEITSFTNKFIPDVDKYNQAVKDYYSDIIKRINNGETKQEALERFNIAIESIVKTSNNKENIGLVSHGNILTLFSAQFKQIN